MHIIYSLVLILEKKTTKSSVGKRGMESEKTYFVLNSVQTLIVSLIYIYFFHFVQLATCFASYYSTRTMNNICIISIT